MIDSASGLRLVGLVVGVACCFACILCLAGSCLLLAQCAAFRVKSAAVGACCRRSLLPPAFCSHWAAVRFWGSVLPLAFCVQSAAAGACCWRSLLLPLLYVWSVVVCC